MIRRFILTAILLLYTLPALGATTIERFPPPDFESDYQLPTTTTPHPRQDIFEYIDALVLAAALALGTYLILKKRSRKLIFALMVFAVAYFGFYRKGCICPIGSIQNVTLTFFDSTYAVPIAILFFFSLPLVVTLLFGRIFCGAVCPLGAIQDLFVFRPMKVPSWLESSLRLLAYLYLGLAVLFVATGSAFAICRYDPFVSFFRLSGRFYMIVIGICMLVIGLFIARPYCRFLCPYGVILRQFSKLSRWRVKITPDDCIKCRLCEDACPFGAIEKPTAEWQTGDYSVGRKRLALLLVAAPVLVAGCAWAFSFTSDFLARAHPTVRLADRIYIEESGQVSDTTDPSLAFRGTGKPIEDLYAEANTIRAQMHTGTYILGIYMGLVISAMLIKSSVRQGRADYEASRGQCLACGRCYDYCPRENVRRKNLTTVNGAAE